MRRDHMYFLERHKIWNMVYNLIKVCNIKIICLQNMEGKICTERAIER